MTTYQATHVTARTAPKKKLLARYRRLLVILSALVIILLSLLIAQGIHYSARAEELNVKTYQSVTISEGFSTDSLSFIQKKSKTIAKS